MCWAPFRCDDPEHVAEVETSPASIYGRFAYSTTIAGSQHHSEAPLGVCFGCDTAEPVMIPGAQLETPLHASPSSRSRPPRGDGDA